MKTIKRKLVLRILPPRKSRHGEPVERKKDSRGVEQPVWVASGPTMMRGLMNLAPENGRQPDPMPP